MPKGTPKKTDERMNALEEKMSAMMDLMTEVIDQKNEQKKEEVIPENQKLQHDIQQMDNISQMLPIKWKQKIEEILGKGFDIEINDSAGGNYVMYFYIPSHLDRRVGEKNGRDHSTGLIRRASDIADIEQWCTRIKQTIKLRFPAWEPIK